MAGLEKAVPDTAYQDEAILFQVVSKGASKQSQKHQPLYLLRVYVYLYGRWAADHLSLLSLLPWAASLPISIEILSGANLYVYFSGSFFSTYRAYLLARLILFFSFLWEKY